MYVQPQQFGGVNLQLLQHDEFPRYALKMATGSGKTKAMSLAIVWQYMNAVVEGRGDFARVFLVLAPNVIVYERLRSDFANAAIFRTDPLIPPELRVFWDFDVYLRGEGERASSTGALYLTNIQQLHDRGGPCVVVNDEAHHTHDEKLKWNEIIRDLHDRLESDAGVIQLDFTATPRFNKGQLFTWTVYDYPLKQAILDGIVKRPVKGMTPGVQERPSDHASVRYQTYLTAGVERWREYREQLAPLGRKPLLFVMMNETAEADDVGEYLQTKYPGEFGGDKLLVIHTNRSGEVTKKDEDRARQVAREVDDAASPVNAIVSVLMLREGWDVQNVTVIVGLRPYSSKANILPEQTIGRGLRLMFRGLGSSYTERVDVIGNPKFMEFIDQLERDEDLKLEQFTVGKDRLVVVTIAPDPAKAERDIELPTVSPILVRKRTLAEEIAALDVAAFRCSPLPLKESSMEAKNFRYEGYDILTMQKLVEREYRIPEPQTAQEVISFYAKRIAQDVKLPGRCGSGRWRGTLPGQCRAERNGSRPPLPPCRSGKALHAAYSTRASASTEREMRGFNPPRGTRSTGRLNRVSSSRFICPSARKPTSAPEWNPTSRSMSLSPVASPRAAEPKSASSAMFHRRQNAVICSRGTSTESCAGWEPC